MLECIRVHKSFGYKPVLSIPDLQLDKGIYWIRGANGSGKTTFLRLIAGLLPFNGDIRLEGFSIQRAPLAYRQLVSWSDAEPLYPGFISGLDLLAFYRDIRQAPPEQLQQLTSLFQAQHYLSSPISTYSSGMIKKLSLILAFIGNPRLIVLDEPLVTLDSQSIPLLSELIRNKYQKEATSFLLSSHQDFTKDSLPVDKQLLVADQSVRLLA